MAAGASTAAFSTRMGRSAERLSKAAKPKTAAARIVIFTAFPKAKATLHDNWGGVVGLRGTGSCDFSVENYYLPRGTDICLGSDCSRSRCAAGRRSCFRRSPSSPRSTGSVAIGAARRALDELIKLATTTRGTFRSSKLDERQVVHRFIGQADLKLRAARALLHQRYEQLYEIAGAGKIPDGCSDRRRPRRRRSTRPTSPSRRSRSVFISPAIPACITRT